MQSEVKELMLSMLIVPGGRELEREKRETGRGGGKPAYQESNRRSDGEPSAHLVK